MKGKRAKRIISLILTSILVLTLMMTGAGAVGDDSSNEPDLSKMYRKYDLETGEVSLVPRYASPQFANGIQITSTNPYFPNDGRDSFGDRSIIGSDDRTQVNLTTVAPY